MEAMFKVYVKGIEFYAFHGVTPEERAIGHRYRCDLELDVEGNADETDQIGGTVDYGIAGQTAVSILQRTDFQTLERGAALCAESILRVFPACQRVEIYLAKRLPPTHLIAEETGVKLIRTRPSDESAPV